MQFTGKGVSRHHRVHRRTQQGTFPTTETGKRKPHTAAAAKENRGERSGRYELSSRRIAPHRPATPARCPHSSSALPNRVAAGREVRSPDPPPLSSLPPPPPPAGPVASHCSIRGRACHTHHARSVGTVVVVEHWDWETSAARVVPCHRQPISPVDSFPPHSLP